jgi:hypothetical protein
MGAWFKSRRKLTGIKLNENSIAVQTLKMGHWQGNVHLRMMLLRYR